MDEISLFFGKTMDEWRDIYALLQFRGKEPKSLRDLMAWQPPLSPQGCMDTAFDLAEARTLVKENPTIEWVRNMLTNRLDAR